MTGRPVPGADVRGEAARLAVRLEVARERLDAARRPGIDDDDEVRALLGPAADRIARLHGIARELADGTTPDASAATAASELAATQPTRRPR
ncbi:hypothetical protein [Dietzia sp. PP-33]|uniref:hypothetical protein n=1 Tax=Dietzia sp. PP-33 TaxID=2957500 RepID=UPI0029B80661|nr:hypothetical protein [Dietzia sp. PP-33]MDX2357068.1 hypothetical protein [Dietzia sp. PP-33]